MVTIHPCKHANVLKSFLDVAKDNGVTIQAH